MKQIYSIKNAGVSKDEFDKLPDAENVLYSISVYLQEQDNEVDQKIAELLKQASFSITIGNQINDSSQHNKGKHTVECVLSAPLEVYAHLVHHLGRIDDVSAIFLNCHRVIRIVTSHKQAPDVWRQIRLNQAVFPSTKFALIERQLGPIKVKLRSPAEDAVFTYFQQREVLFFPCCLAISGNKFREPDYLVCSRGKWGIFEIVKNSTHDTEKDAERTQWFHKNKLQIWSVPYQDCITSPDRVVKEFLDWLESL